MKVSCLIMAIVTAFFLAGCGSGGDGGGSSASTGTVSMAITDAKPALPAGVEKVIVTIDEVSIHRSEGGWTSLTLAQNPFTIDLLQFSGGGTTQLVPQTTLLAGHITQVRLSVKEATIIIDGVSHAMEVPSDSLKTDKNFDFDITGGGAVNLTVDFDLSQSIVVTGSGTYKLKPVLHLVKTEEAATIRGGIASSTFGNTNADNFATVVVTLDKDNSGSITTGVEEYTRVIVEKPVSGNATFDIFWLVPNQRYVVRVWIGDDLAANPKLTEAVGPTVAGAIYNINGGNPI